MNSLVKISDKLVRKESRYNITCKITDANWKEMGILWRALHFYKAYAGKNPEFFNTQEEELATIDVVMKAFDKCSKDRSPELNLTNNTN